MKDLRDFYILGSPIQTEIGECHFIKVKEYPHYFMDLNVFSLTKLQLINRYTELNKKLKDDLLDDFIKEIDKLELFELMISIPELKESYIRIFSKAFLEDNVLEKIDNTNFYYYRELIMEMNCIKEEKNNPNPEIQKAIERSKRVKQFDSDRLEFEDIVTSVVGYNGLNYNDINDFTIYQLYATFYRIAQIKNYDTSTLFATVTDKVKVDSWSKHINLYEEEKHSITKEEFNNKSNEIFN